MSFLAPIFISPLCDVGGRMVHCKLIYSNEFSTFKPCSDRFQIRVQQQNRLTQLPFDDRAISDENIILPCLRIFIKMFEGHYNIPDALVFPYSFGYIHSPRILSQLHYIKLMKREDRRITLYPSCHSN